MHTLLGISFLIHLLTILAIVVLYQRRSLQRASLPSMKEDVETLHESMEAFINEVEKENELLYERIVEHLAEKENHLHQEIEKLADQIVSVNEKDNENNIKIDNDKNQNQDKNHEKDIATEKTIEKIVPTQLQKVNEPVKTYEEQEPVPIEVKADLKSAEGSAEAKFKQAKDLYIQGFSIEQIAKILHIGKGETALIVNMMEKSKELPQ